MNELASQVGAGAWMEFVVAEGEVTTAHLAALEEVQSVRLLSDEHAPIKRFRVAGNAALGTALSGLAAQHGWQLSALIPHAASLEEVFLSLVEAE